MKENEKVIYTFFKEAVTFEEKTKKIIQEVGELRRKPNVKPEEIIILIGRIIKLMDNFNRKLEAIQKMASKI